MATFKRHEDIVAWQLAHELKERIFAITETPKVRRDVKFCDQIREAARSAPRNIAEGFRRYRPKEFAKFGETQNHLTDGRARHYGNDEQHDQLQQLASRAIGACIRLHEYLMSCPDRPPESPDRDQT